MSKGASNLARRHGEHRLALDVGHEPGRFWKQIGVGRVIVVIVRQRQVCDRRPRLAGIGKLHRQWFYQSEVALLLIGQHQMVLHGRSGVGPFRVRNGASIPKQHPSGMSDQIASHGQVQLGDFVLLQLEPRRIGDMQRAAVENVEPHEPRWLSPATRDKSGQQRVR